MTQGPLAADVPLYKPFGCKSNDWVRFLKANEELRTGHMVLSADHKSKAVLQDDGNFVVSFYPCFRVSEQSSARVSFVYSIRRSSATLLLELIDHLRESDDRKKRGNGGELRRCILMQSITIASI